MNLYQGTLELTDKFETARDTVVLHLKLIKGEHLVTKEKITNQLPYQAGQFINLLVADKTWRSYSVASTPTEDEIELVIRYVPDGIGSEAIKKWSVGAEIEFKGAFGHFGLSDTAEAVLHFCATGTGIAPFKAMIREEGRKESPRTMHLYYGGRDTEDLAYLAELKNWAPNVHLHLGLSRQSELPGALFFFGKNDGEDKIVEIDTCRITKFIEDKNFAKNDEIYLCGNGNMVKSVVEILETKNVNQSQIFQERFN